LRNGERDYSPVRALRKGAESVMVETRRGYCAEALENADDGGTSTHSLAECHGFGARGSRSSALASS